MFVSSRVADRLTEEKHGCIWQSKDHYFSTRRRAMKYGSEKERSIENKGDKKTDAKPSLLPLISTNFNHHDQTSDRASNPVRQVKWNTARSLKSNPEGYEPRHAKQRQASDPKPHPHPFAPL